ncbi:hypothetical protein Rhopal_004392-T1 [Rhodotorula paludigena]|uniref:Peptidase A1 domain-containing protein n=1 Tax=Rhodotorula paludigena TaxID=86838 RepID=A0AAV5GFW8_9BASI|nr:hypothetical protein Rhopal_004392-T1 [Rhodotorula paludigena]
MLVAVLALLSVCAPLACAQASPPFLDPTELSRLLSASQERHRASLDAYSTNVASRPEVIRLAKSAKSRAVQLEQQHGLGRLRERGQGWTRFERRQQQGGGAQRGVVELFDFFSQPLDIMVYGEVSVGAPAQTFDLLMDTGSADMWVYAKGTGSTQEEWDASASSTSVTSPQIPWEIRYGKGEQTGYLNQDTVTLGGYTVNATIFAAADTLNDAFTYYPISGLFGLGFGSISASGYAPWFERLLNDGTLSEQYFSIYLVRASDVTSQPEGSLPGAQLCIGCVDSSKYTGEINWIPVESEGFWAIPMDGIEVNGTVIDGTGVRAVIDSGTTLIQVPTAQAEAFYASIPGAVPARNIPGSYIVPCSTRFSSLSLVFGGTRYEIPDKDLLRAISIDGRQCILTVAASDSQDVDGNYIAIIGDVFLKNAYSIYSYSHNGAPAIGLAQSIIAGAANSTSEDDGGFTQPAVAGTLSLGSGAPLPTASRSASVGRPGGGGGVATTGGLGSTNTLGSSSPSQTTSPGSGAARTAFTSLTSY